MNRSLVRSSIIPFPIHIEFELVNDAFIVEVQNRIAFRCDGYIPDSILCQAEAFVVTADITCDNRIIFVIIVIYTIRDISTHPAVLVYVSAGHLVCRSVQKALLPVNNSIWGILIGIPFGIKRSVLGQKMGKIKLDTRRDTIFARSPCEPSGKGKTFTCHRPGICRQRACFHKLRSRVGGAFTVFNKHNPVTIS